MGVLKSIKHEKFAQGIALGMSASPAYVQAGYVKNDGNASRLKNNEGVAARITELAEGAATAWGKLKRNDHGFRKGAQRRNLADPRGQTAEQIRTSGMA